MINVRKKSMREINKNNNEKQSNIWGLLKRSLWAGIATIFPLFITIYAIILIFRFADKFVGKYLNLFLVEQYGISIPGIGLIVLLVVLVVVGLLSRIFLGRWLTSVIDKLFKKTPLIANIYPSAKKLSDFLFSEEESKKKFRKVVLVEFPTQGSWSIGFITNDKLDDFKEALSDEFVCVFVPLAPAPFSGFVYWAAKNKVKEINISVDQAIKFVLSGGVVSK
jgi:uncharacterized membrane protein